MKKKLAHVNKINNIPLQLKEKVKLVPISVNWHVWKYCNYSCTFCFSRFSEVPKNLPKEKALIVPELLAEAGTEKLTFAGGEPLLCPWLSNLLRISKNHGLTTMLITNASLVTRSYLEKISEYLDWFCVSIDSSSEAIEFRLGRGRGSHIKNALHVVDLARELGIKIKLNTVITSLNWKEDFSPILKRIKPDRWKVFQVLPIQGQNDSSIGPLLITTEQFQEYLQRHQQYNPIAEFNDDMIGSYLMLDPLARFFDNTHGYYRYSPSIIDVGVETALNYITWNYKKFEKRGGLYKWK